MTWTPNSNKPAPVFTGPLIDNTLTIVRRDFKEALDYYFPAESYPDFREIAVGMLKEIVFPSFAVNPVDVDTIESEDGSWIAVQFTFDSYIGITANNDADATAKIQRYQGVIDAVYRKAEKDFCDDISNAHEMTIELSHEFGPRGVDRGRTLYFRSVITRGILRFRQGFQV